MKLEKILVVCVGNICRSPTAEYLLKNSLPGLSVTSAGLGALVGHDMDEMARTIAEENGLICPVHKAKQLTVELCRESDLILVMENRHREEVSRLFLGARGKAFLLGVGGQGPEEIPDPYRKNRDAFFRAYNQIDFSVRAWVKKLSPR